MVTIQQTAKEILRAGLTKVGLYDVIRKARGKSLDHLDKPSREGRFSRIYEKGHWTLGDAGNPLSGSGSSLEVTGPLRAQIPDLLGRVGTRTLLDIGCGDFTWMKELDLSGMKYIGADIVKDVVATNEQRFGSENVRFVSCDAVTDDLPEADVVLIRETLFHLCFDDVKALLANVLRKDRSWLLMTSDSLSGFNADIRTGDFRLLNLRAAPFRLPRPNFVIDESIIRPGRHLGAWRAKNVREALGPIQDPVLDSDR